MPDDKFFIKQGDTRPKLEFFIENVDGSPVNLTGASVVLNMRVRPAGSSKISDGSVAVVNVATGECAYTFSTSDTNTADDYELDVSVSFSDGGILTVPNDGYLIVPITDDV
jgi:hypothetical protein